MPCVSCNGATTLVWQEGAYHALACQHCGLIQTQGPLSPDLFDADYFINNYLFQEEVRIRHFQAILHQAQVTVTAPLLDVGAGVGFFLKSLAPDLRATAAAVEPAPFAREQLLQQGVAPVIVPALDALPATVGPFATATLWDVLAGVPHPLELLDGIRLRLAPAGQLIIKTPHHPLRLFHVARLLTYARKGRAVVHVPAQWFHFTPRALTQMLATAGFQVVKMTWTSEPPIHYPRLSRRVKEGVMGGLLRLSTPHPSILCVAQRSR